MKGQMGTDKWGQALYDLQPNFDLANEQDRNGFIKIV